MSRDDPSGAEVSSLESLRIGLECRIPETITVARGNTVYLHGWCYHPAQRIARLEIVAGSVSRPVKVYGTVRSDVFSVHHPRLDPLGHSFRSGFWGILPLAEVSQSGPVDICLRATLQSGEQCSSLIGTPLLAARSAAAPADFSPAAANGPLVAICMATFNPPAALFKAQIESLVEQSYKNWICIISDDCSRPDIYSEIRALTRQDPRFSVHQAPERLGFYRNFEHCLALVPDEVSFVALCDHDDAWHADKLQGLLAAFDSRTMLAYSDMRIVDDQGRLISNTYWTTRVNNHENLSSLLLANTVTGAASMFRRELLETVLPFPELPGEPYHDHWIACVALAIGKIAYVDRPLYDYVQHDRNVIGHYAPNGTSWLENVRIGLASTAALNYTMTLWRNIYFGDVLRIELIAGIIEQRCSKRLDGRNRKILQRLSRMDDRLSTCAWLALRRVTEIWRGNETLAAETRLLRGVFWRYCSTLRSRFGPGPQIRRPAQGGSSPTGESYAQGILDPVSVIRNKIAPLNLAVNPDAIRRVNLLIPTIDFEYVFGGYIAKFCLAQKLSELGFTVRLVIVDYCDYKSALWKQQLRSFAGIGALLDSCELVYAFDRTVPLAVSPRDSFIATTWWTAHIARHAANALFHREFLYLIQEFEPFTFPMGTFACLARETYNWPHRAVFSTELLQEYFRQQRLGVFADSPEDAGRRFAVFQNAITEVGPLNVESMQTRPTRKLLFYARPEAHAARNMFELGILALCSAIEAGVFDDRWEFTGIGSVGASGTVPLAKGRRLHLVQRQSQSDYKKVLTTHDLGLSLMYTPHPSLVPIEMASAGMTVVTNTFENKTADSLQRISSNIIATAPTVDELTEALRKSAARTENFAARAAGAEVNWCKDWNHAFSETVLRRIVELLEEISG